MTHGTTTRRDLLAGGAFVAATLALGSRVRANTAPIELIDAPFTFEVQRTEAEWQAMLSEAEYLILRQNETEWPTTSPLWDDYSAGEFGCRGCGLHLYSSAHRAPIDKGWVFFYHAQPDAVLTGIEQGNPYTMAADSREALIEAHCRRCGSHLGHILTVDGAIVHCINGTSLIFRPAEA